MPHFLLAAHSILKKVDVIQIDQIPRWDRLWCLKYIQNWSRGRVVLMPNESEARAKSARDGMVSLSLAWWKAPQAYHGLFKMNLWCEQQMSRSEAAAEIYAFSWYL